MTERTFFGLEIVSARGVRSTEIANLPFAGFRAESAVGSGQLQDPENGDWLVHLHDWKAFSSLFIATGRHRHMPRTPHVHWCDCEEDEPDRTYFGLEVQSHQFVSKVDIARLPFGAFWQKHCRALQVFSAAKSLISSIVTIGQFLQSGLLRLERDCWTQKTIIFFDARG